MISNIKRLLVVLFLLAQTVFFTSCSSNTEVIIEGDQFHPANHKQYAADVQMSAKNGILYFYFPPTANDLHYQSSLCSYDSGVLKKHHEVTGKVIAFHDGYLYYTIDPEFGKQEIYCYELMSGQEQFVSSVIRDGGDYLRQEYTFVDSENVLYIQNDNVNFNYCPVNGSHYGEPGNKNETYSFDGWTYTVSDNQFHGKDIVGISETGEAVHYDEMVDRGKLSVIPCEDGLLIHGEMYGNLLYYVDGTTGSLHKLFSVPADRTVSAVTVHGNYAYLSFMRYENYDTLFPKRYDNDHLEGTYRIHLKDFSIEKISDSIYSGLFVFDDSGIYACDSECGIFKIDFDGSILMTFLE